MSTVIKGGLVVDQTGERTADVVVDDGRVVAVGPDLSGDLVLDASGCVVAPGFVDLHTHLRQPGAEEAETIETGGWAAVRGGFSAVVAMPNTNPTIDCAAVVQEVLVLGRQAPCDVYTSGAITVGRKGEQLAPMAEMAALGVRLFTDDGNGVQDSGLMRRAMEYAAGLGVVLAQHCEDSSLSAGGHMHEGEWSSHLGIPGVPAEAEELMVMRDIALSRFTGAPVHFQHLSTRGSIAMVRAARQVGLSITAEAATHHFTSPTRPALPTTRYSRSTRPCARPTTGKRCARAWPTGRSTPLPPTTPPIPPTPKKCPSTRRRRGCSAWRPLWLWR